jgi:outer membrane receptor for Fe3+-dicitrate
VNNVSLVTGAHTAKFGVDANILKSRSTFDPGSNGIYTFNSLADYLARRPFQYQQFAGTGTVDSLTNQVAFYLQDEWRLRPGLTVSPGLRYEMAFTPDYADPTVAENRFPLATEIPDALDLIAPRLGLSWDPTGSGRTVLRAAGGIFYNAPHVPIYEQAIRANGGNPELSSEVIITTAGNANAVAEAFNRFGVNLPGAPLGSLPSFSRDQLNGIIAPENRIGSTVYFVDPDFQLPRAAHFRVAVERKIASGVMATLDFTNVSTTRIARVRNINLEAPVPDATGRPVYTSARPYGPKYGFVNMTESTARSRYQGLTAGLNVNRPKYVLDVYYTLSGTRSEDDLERPVNSIAYNDAFDLASEYTWANIDQRHQFTGNAMVFLPYELQVATTFRLNSGRPYTASAGTDLNRDGVLRDRPVIDGMVVGRNTYRNTSFSELNLRVQRSFSAIGRSRMVLSLELFNVFNATNIELGSGNMVYGPGTVLQNGVPAAQAPPSNFGQIKDAEGKYFENSVLRTSPFQAQLGLRFQF